MPTSRDMAIFVLTTMTQPMWGNNNNYVNVSNKREI